jgi:phospholipase/carboxylesterase
MALQLMRSAPARFDYGVQLAGFVVDDAQPGDQVLAHRRPPFFWGRGELDAVIPGQAIVRTRSWMAAHTSSQEVVYPQMGHDVAGREVTDVVSFVARMLPARSRRGIPAPSEPLGCEPAPGGGTLRQASQP